MNREKIIGDVSMVPEELQDVLEYTAECVHDTWAAGRSSEGWVYGDIVDSVNKTTPNLVPYAELSENEKDYDRRTASAVILALIAEGYHLTK